MRKRAATWQETWQEMMRLNLELQLIPIAAPIRARHVPMSYAGRDSHWLDNLPEGFRGKRRTH